METEACHYLEMCCDPEDVVDVSKPPIYVEDPTNTVKIETENQIKETTEFFGGHGTDRPGAGPTSAHYEQPAVTDHTGERDPSSISGVDGFTDRPTGSHNKNEKIDPYSRKTSEELTDSTTFSPPSNTEDCSEEVTTKPQLHVSFCQCK